MSDEVRCKLSVLRKRGKNDLKSAKKTYSPCAGPMVQRRMTENTATNWEGHMRRSVQIQLEHDMNVLFRKEASDKGDWQ